MARQVSCPNGHKLQVSSAQLGKQVRCPTCKASFVAADASPQPEPPAREDSLLPSELRDLAAGDSGGRGTSRFAQPGLGLSLLTVSRVSLILGMLLVVVSRGCDTIGRRGVERTKQRLDTSKAEFADEWQIKEAPVEEEIDELEYQIVEQRLQGQQDAGQLETKRDEANQKLEGLSRQKQKEERALQRSAWHELEIAVRDAEAANDMSAYWREWLFLFGSIIVVPAIIVMSSAGDGAERWVSFIVLAIITFSLYIGGIAWIAGKALS